MNIKVCSTSLLKPCLLAIMLQLLTMSVCAASPVKYTGDPKWGEAPFTLNMTPDWHPVHVMKSTSHIVLISTPDFMDQKSDLMTINCVISFRQDAEASFNELYKTALSKKADCTQVKIGKYSGGMIVMRMHWERFHWDNKFPTLVEIQVSRNHVIMAAHMRVNHKFTPGDRASLLAVLSSIKIDTHNVGVSK